MYEQAYQELKKSGQFNFTVVPNKALTSPRVGRSSQFGSPVRQPLTSPRHAAAYAHLRPDADFPHSRDTSLDLAADAAAPPQLAALFNRDSIPATEPKSPQHLSPEKRLSKRKSFFTIRGASLRAPSLSSLKRGRSHANISETFIRTSDDKPTRTPSMSPEKPIIHSHLTLQSLPRSQSKKELNKTVKLNKRVSDLESKLADARRELNNAITNASPLPPIPSRFEKFTPTSKSKSTRARFGLSGKTRSFLPADYYDQAPMDPAAIASSEAVDQSEVGDRPSLDSKLKALDASIKSKVKKTPTKKRKSASKDDGIYKSPAYEEEDELEFVKEKPKKKRKSTGKKATNVESANDQSGSEIGHGKMHKTNTKKQDSSKQHAIEQTTELPPPSRPSMDTLDPINEEENIVVAPRVNSTNSLVPSQHDSAICAADAEAIHVRTDPLKSILVNKYEAARPSSRSSSKRPSSSQRRSSPPPDTVYTKPTLVTIEKDHIITATPGVDSVPVLPTALDKTTDIQVGAAKPYLPVTIPHTPVRHKRSTYDGGVQVTDTVTVELQENGTAALELRELLIDDDIDDETLELLEEERRELTEDDEEDRLEDVAVIEKLLETDDEEDDDTDETELDRLELTLLPNDDELELDADTEDAEAVALPAELLSTEDVDDETLLDEDDDRLLETDDEDDDESELDTLELLELEREDELLISAETEAILAEDETTDEADDDTDDDELELALDELLLDTDDEALELALDEEELVCEEADEVICEAKLLIDDDIEDETLELLEELEDFEEERLELMLEVLLITEDDDEDTLLLEELRLLKTDDVEDDEDDRDDESELDTLLLIVVVVVVVMAAVAVTKLALTGFCDA
ncbi:hypothetical protein E4T44_06924 [Aureobasidium sp. EXF-8845]|nr:hypothetical protein E4T44_06924 [Aureobasidium sp. EXF-8845]KAI4847178.1 hypothetical protein E4T45_06893 [Aureobasidium sp. EXF-8846]